MKNKLNQLLNKIASLEKTSAAAPLPPQARGCVVCPPLPADVVIGSAKKKTPLSATSVGQTQSCGPGFLTSFGDASIRQSYQVNAPTTPLPNQKLYATCAYYVLSGVRKSTALLLWSNQQPQNDIECLDSGEQFQPSYCWKEVTPAAATNAPGKIANPKV